MITTKSRSARGGFTAAERSAILTDPCHYCGDDPDEVDHLVPWSCGGSDGYDNLVAACYRCNRDKGGLTPDEWRAAREDRGAAWPPPSGVAVVADLLAGLDVTVEGILDWNDVRPVLDVLLPQWSAYIDHVHRHGPDPAQRERLRCRYRVRLLYVVPM